MVEKLNPHVLVEEAPLLSSDAFIHVLHQKANAIGEVTEGFFNIDHPPPGIVHLKAHVSFVVSFSPQI